MKLSFYIAKRYLFAKKSRNAINVISAVSVAGVTVGTMALIIILSVFNGLEEMVRSIFNTSDPDLRISLVEGKVFKPDSVKLSELLSITGISAYSLALEENALLKYGDRQYIAIIKGVEDNYSSITRIDSSMYDGRFLLTDQDGEPFAVIGMGVATYLGIRVNFITPLSIYMPNRTGSISGNLENAFIRKLIWPSGIFEIEQDFDSKYVFVPITFMRELLDYNDEVSSIEIKIKEGADIKPIEKEVKTIFGSNFSVKNQYEQQEIFYKVMKSERVAIFLILSLILIIASFNIIGSLTMLIIEKERDIIILRSLGADNNLIKKIFIFEGWMISVIGASGGLLFGFLICWLQHRYGLVRLQSEALLMDAYPVIMKLKDFIIVLATVLLIGYWAAWYPVRYLTKKYLVNDNNPNLKKKQE
jgi:lipoprotein-releasing system permease protein